MARMRIPLSGGTIALALIALALGNAAPARALDEMPPLSVGPEFTAALDLGAIREIAVQDEGRVKTFDSLAREKLKYVNPSRAARGDDPVLRYLDMMFAPDHYQGTNVVYIKKPQVRQALVAQVRALTGPMQRTGTLSDQELERIESTGYVSIAFLDRDVVRQALSVLERDLMRTNKEVQALHAARAVADSRWLRQAWKVVPPPGGSEIAPWFPAHATWASLAPQDDVHQTAMGGGGMDDGIPGLAEATRQTVARALTDLEMGWQTQNAATANEALATLTQVLPTIEPSIYPSESRRHWEHWYYSRDKLTSTWLFYFFALPFLLMAVVYGFRWARFLGLALFGLGFAAHTFSIGLRWYLAGRIPNANMFEAIMASAWFGCVFAIVLEIVLRKRALRTLAPLSASAYAMTALMCGHFMPVQLNSDIITLMPVLDRTVWLYIHTNMVIASYSLIFFAAVTALFYLGGRAAYALSSSPRLAAGWTGASGVAGAGGGAAAMILAGPSVGTDVKNTGLSRALDGATMIFMELAFLTLGIGTILGAVWADVSWGRPWGWDPKEVFALNTWLVLLILVHVRLKVRDKALWTAVLALVATAVMLFNWIAINFVVTGLHSYA